MLFINRLTTLLIISLFIVICGGTLFAQSGSGGVILIPPTVPDAPSGEKTPATGDPNDSPIAPPSWLIPSERDNFKRNMDERRKKEELQRAFEAEEQRMKIKADRDIAERVRKVLEEQRKAKEAKSGTETITGNENSNTEPTNVEGNSIAPPATGLKPPSFDNSPLSNPDDTASTDQPTTQPVTENAMISGRRPFNFIPVEEHLEREGWCQLFDGRTFTGWRIQDSESSPYRGGRFFMTKAEPGIIHSDPAHPGLLLTTGQFGNASITFDFQCPDDAIVYLLLRTPPSPRDLHSSCYTVVLNSPKQYPGTILGREVKGGSSDNSLTHTGIPMNSREDTWIHCSAIFDRETIKVTVGQADPVAFYDTAPLGYGHIGLLVAKGPAKFKNILWAPGASVSLFNGNDLGNWRYDKSHAPSIARGNDVAITLSGPSVIECKQEFKNYSLQLEFAFPYSSTPSGVFFRSQARQAKTGYDCSLHLSPPELYTKSKRGLDAGGLVGLADAKFLGVQDRIWSRLTINVIDRHIQTWIDGILVCDWGDLRPINPSNPTGPFLETGTIQLNAREVGSKIMFRNIQVSEAMTRTFKPKQQESTSWNDQVDRYREQMKKQSEDDSLILTPNK
ncbi:MAG: DUF1080 domain-containing protein [Planctomycetaceae bacterium]|jgi:hypothetical protein|nr:DUF1080 domain-containing protein [Planctomycetaceae bacterium]